jgi:hypothetical protein
MVYRQEVPRANSARRISVSSFPTLKCSFYEVTVDMSYMIVLLFIHSCPRMSRMINVRSAQLELVFSIAPVSRRLLYRLSIVQPFVSSL